MHKAKLSVIIAARNEGHQIGKCVGSVAFADEILVLDSGEIVERGKHDDLLAKGGVYAAMWNRQREVDEAEETLRRAEAAEGRSVRVAVQD